jgi:hypothetical protein
MNCNEVKPRLIEAVYGEVPAEFRAALEEHLAGCPACRLEYAKLEQADQALDLVPERTAAVDLSRLYRVATARSRQSARRWRRAAIAAAAVLVVVSAVAMWRGRIEVGPERLVISWRAASGRPHSPPSAAADPVATLAGHARHLATLDETIGLLVAELDANERERLESLRRLREQVQGLQRRNHASLELVQDDIRALYLASFSPESQDIGDRP